jgi:cytochrome b subunit of formate dehydrogenase
VLFLLVVLFVSGAGELGKFVSLFEPLRVLAGPHGLAAGAAAALVAMHIYLGMIHPPTRAAFRGITLGSVDREWAEHHHGLWVADVDRERRGEEASTPRAP